MYRVCLVSVLSIISCSLLFGQISQSEYSALLPEFTSLHGSSSLPVAGMTFDDVESTFGPRFQQSTSQYDFHRGIDVDGTEGDDILAVADGVFWEYREFDAGGHTVILRHDFDSTVTLNGRSYDHYYTYYMHLYDPGTLTVINGWQEEKNNTGLGEVITAGQHIGEMGSSGSSGGLPYADHLHMEVRVGTTNSLAYQLEDLSRTQHGFDPHLHPMLFFEPETFGGPDYSPTAMSRAL
ncbi:MAG: M23 family metallopeptidase [Opitutales bacterium]|nr:M23 family metallopeptidase [Opitutales bacterium]